MRGFSLYGGAAHVGPRTRSSTMPNPFAHIELTTDNLAAAEKFYRSIFAWKLSAMPGMNYTMIDVGEGVGGGMQSKQMPDAPTGWLAYVTVDDVKKTMAKAIKGGATPMLEYQEIGDMGAIGIFKDPFGSSIGIWAPKKPTKAPAKKALPKAAKKTGKKVAKKTAKKVAKKAAKKKR
jgi:predicted enzyme related to lactoylglutathione lyase